MLTVGMTNPVFTVPVTIPALTDSGDISVFTVGLTILALRHSENILILSVGVTIPSLTGSGTYTMYVYRPCTKYTVCTVTVNIQLLLVVRTFQSLPLLELH